MRTPTRGFRRLLAMAPPLAIATLIASLIPSLPLRAQTPRPGPAAAPALVTGEAATRLFVYQARPVHPFCVAFPFDSARTKPIDLATCTDANVAPSTEADGWLAAKWPPDRGGNISYRVLAAKGERFLIASDLWGGGSGYFSALRWVRLDGRQVVIVKDEEGGDRCAGGLSDFELDRATLRFKQHLRTADMMALTGVKLDAVTADRLSHGYGDCDGDANYRYDLQNETVELSSVSTTVDPAAAAALVSGTAERNPQACLESLVRQFAAAGTRNFTLLPDDIRELGRRFVATCAAPAAQVR